MASVGRFVNAQLLIFLFSCCYKQIYLTVFPQNIRGKRGLSTLAVLWVVILTQDNDVPVVLNNHYIGRHDNGQDDFGINWDDKLYIMLKEHEVKVKAAMPMKKSSVLFD